MNSRSLALSADPAGSEVERPVLGQARNGKGHSAYFATFRLAYTIRLD